MKLRTRALGVCLLATLAAAAAIGSGNAAAATSPVVGHVYVNDNTAGTNTIAGFNRHADGTLTPMQARRSPPAERALVAAWQARARSRCRRRPVLLAVDRRQQPDLGAADRAGGALTPISGGVGLVARHPAGQRRVHEPSSTSPTPATAAATTPGSGCGQFGHLRHLRGSTVACPTDPARRRVVQLDRHQPGRHAGRHLADRQLQGHVDGRLAAARARRSRPRAPARSAASSGRPTPPAVRVQRTRRSQRRHRLGLRRGRPGALRRSGPRPSRTSRRPLLGRDQPRRQLPVRREHRRAQHLAVPDRGGRLPDAAGQHRSTCPPAWGRWTHDSRLTARRCGGRLRAPPRSAGSP